MGTTASGFWFPDSNVPIAGLHTLLAQMQKSAETARTALKTELGAPLPFASVYTTGAPQSFPGSAEFNLTGNSGGWMRGTVNAAAMTAGIQAQPGIRSEPILLTQAGLYVIFYVVTHTIATGNGGAPGHAYTDIVLSGSISYTVRSVWSLGYQTSNTAIVQLPAGSTSVGLRSFVDTNGGVVNYAEMAVWKLQ